METNQLGRCFASHRWWEGGGKGGEGETVRRTDLDGRCGT